MENTLLYKTEDFEGPLDLLLHLIAKNKLNIYDIPVAELLEQYLAQIDAMREQNMDVQSEFLEMASRLIYIKTVSLLPKHDEIVRLKEELTGELLEYQLCREMAEKLSGMTGGFDRFVRVATEYDFDKTYELVHSSDVMYQHYLAAVGRGQRKLPPSVTPFTKIVAKKIVSVSSKVVYVLRNLRNNIKVRFSSLFEKAESRSELVATFLAVLELCKANRIQIDGDAENSEITLIRGHKK